MGGMDAARLEGVMTNLNSVLQRAATGHGERPAVAEVAVIGILHDGLGEEVGAAVTLKRGAVATPAELRAFARARMAPYKYPRFVWLVPGLPKGPTGKILRREVQLPEDLR